MCARIAIRIGAERERIARPRGLGDSAQALPHVAAERGANLLDRKPRERAVALVLERAREFAAEIPLDHRPAEWPERIAAGLARRSRAGKPRVGRQILGAVEAQ